MKESLIEKHLIATVKARGGFTRKVVYQGRKGAPDRWCFFPNGKLVIIELKKLGEKPRIDQEVEIEKLREMGQRVFVVDCKEQIDALWARML